MKVIDITKYGLNIPDSLANEHTEAVHFTRIRTLSLIWQRGCRAERNDEYQSM
jgi:hypothetical protein